MRASLASVLLPLAGVLTLASPANAATFAEPRALTAWDSGAGLLAAAPGAAAWSQPGGVWLAAGGGAARRVSEVGGSFSQVRVATQDGERPVVAWIDDEHRVHALAGGGDQRIDGVLPRQRTAALTPTVVAWIGIAADNSRRIQLATRASPGARFGDAVEPPQLGRPSYGLAAAGAGGRSLLAWHAQDGERRRVATLAVDASGRPGVPRWRTPTDSDATSPRSGWPPTAAPPSPGCAACRSAVWSRP